MKHTPQKWICILLSAALLLALAGCGRRSRPQEAPETASTPVSPPSAAGELAPSRTRPLTLCYSAEDSLNPFYADTLYNCALDSLMYEGLFSVDESGSWQNVLCSSCSTSDGIRYTLKLAGGVLMHDGAALTADDVVYSLQLAAASEKYKARLSAMVSVAADESGAVSIQLSRANYNFPALLDIPIIRSGSGDDGTPPGTGPYILSSGDDGSRTLTAFSSHRDYARLGQKTILLADMDYAETRNAFVDGNLDILVSDPMDNSSYTLDRSYDFHYFAAPVLEYIGFNTQRPYVQSAAFRQAIHHLIDRQSLVDTVMDGHALATSVLFSPVSRDYSEKLEEGRGYLPEKAEEILNNLGYTDRDGDGYREAPSGSSFLDFTLTFIVNSGNKYKTEAAHAITDSLNAAGILTNLQILPWESYCSALESGQYDLYFGEVCLTADNDFTCMLSAGGSCNYGRFNNSNYDTLLAAYLSASTDEQRASAAGALCDAVYEGCSVSPLMYKQYAVIAKRNAISGMEPSYGSFYGGISQWIFSLT